MKRVRKAVVDDAEAIARVHVSAWQHAYRGIIPDEFLNGLSVQKRTDFWRSELTRESRQTLVVESQEEIVGFAGFGPCRDDDAVPGSAELYAIYVAPSHWGGGFGSVLLCEVERILKSTRNTQVTLWVLSDNQPGRRFYERRGFASDGTFKDISISGKKFAEVRYVRRF